jgi:hypothetical protein
MAATSSLVNCSVPMNGDARVGLSLHDFVSDGLHQMRFAESGVAVDEQRVVDLAWCLAEQRERLLRRAR